DVRALRRAADTAAPYRRTRTRERYRAGGRRVDRSIAAFTACGKPPCAVDERTDPESGAGRIGQRGNDAVSNLDALGARDLEANVGILGALRDRRVERASCRVIEVPVGIHAALSSPRRRRGRFGVLFVRSIAAFRAEEERKARAGVRPACRVESVP